ncbi:NAD-dependent epimerase/dehydratase family protein [candidate division KSB1 bacterium]|nr:NAD-dependent epimerase/dehydratase family protein [candidate division KSB1 bacterium]
MRILVTGGAGFIGSHLADKFLAEGHEVAVLDNFSTGFRRHVPPAARLYEGDLRDTAFLRRVFEDFKPEAVDHHAAQIDVRKSLEDPASDAQTNVIGSIALILAAVRGGVRKFVYASTGGAIYGEPNYLPADEAHPVRPECAYGISKHTVEHYLELYRVLEGLQYVVLRYSNVYGPRQNPHGEAGVNAIFIGRMLEGKAPTIYGDGEQLRDYIHVGDVARANLLALRHDRCEIYNIGCGIGTSVNEIVRLLSRIMNFRELPIYAPARMGELQKIYLDARKAKRELGWMPAMDFETGLRETVNWFRQARAAEPV